MSIPNGIKPFSINQYPFNRHTIIHLEENVWIKNRWPIVYILSSSSQNEAYVGESASAIKRLKTHLSHPEKRLMDCLHIITSPQFHKSAAFDIEASLIQYLVADASGKGYRLLNGTWGYVGHNYYGKEEYQSLFEKIWKRLQEKKMATQDLQDIDNSDIFKYSPYKSFSADQYNSICEIIEMLISDRATALVEGAAGTGKTVIAIFLMKTLVSPYSELYDTGPDEEMLKTEESAADRILIRQLKKIYPSPKVALVVPMKSFRHTLKSVFSKVRGLHANMVVGPSEVVGKAYDILIVDEGHRLRKRKNITNYASYDKINKALGLGKEGTELDWIRKSSNKQIFFYDQAQSVRPSDADKQQFDALRKEAVTLKLHSQFRVKGGNDYITYVEQLLNLRLPENAPIFEQDQYEFLFFDHIADFAGKIAEKEIECGLSRMAAGYSWKWMSKKIATVMDIEIEGMQFQWNREYDQWINSKNAAREIGCIHTTQGYDLNYIGVIFGKEISYNPKIHQIDIHPEHFYDTKTKAGIKDPAVLKRYILNIYQNMLYRGIKGAFVYAIDPALRTYLKQHIRTYVPPDNIDRLLIMELK